MTKLFHPRCIPVLRCQVIAFVSKTNAPDLCQPTAHPAGKHVQPESRSLRPPSACSTCQWHAPLSCAALHSLQRCTTQATQADHRQQDAKPSGAKQKSQSGHLRLSADDVWVNVSAPAYGKMSPHVDRASMGLTFPEPQQQQVYGIERESSQKQYSSIP